MMRTTLIALALGGCATAAAAQAQPDSHAGHGASQPPGSATSARRTSEPAPAPHAGHSMPMGMPVEAVPAPAEQQRSPEQVGGHTGHDAGAGPNGPGGATAANQAVGDAAPPTVIRDNAADRVYGVGPMNRARDFLVNEHGAVQLSKVMLNIAEYQSQPPGGGYRWDAEAWYGGDINRFVFKTEGEGSGREGVELAELQVLYSRAVARYTDVQIGVRHDPEPGPSRTYATVGLESLFPYWFEAEGAAFLSDRGELIGRLEGTYDLRLTQRLVLQPQAELRLSAQDIPKLQVGTGLTHVEFGLRLRYEIRREFAPYIGVSYERALGGTADFVRAAGEDVEALSFVAGIRTWF